VGSENTGGRWVPLGNHGEPNPLVPGGEATLFSLQIIKMPGYGGKMEKYAPAPVEEVETVEKRFVMPKMPALTVVQIMLVATIAVYAYTARKMNGVVVSTLALTVALLHVYDHMYRVKRGPEQLFFLPKKEAYGCMACKK